MRKWRIVLLFLPVFLISCVDENGNPVSEEFIQYNDVSLMKASSADISDNVVSADEVDGVRIVICHRPPGNPANEKTKELPLSAIKAHLNHGHADEGDEDHLGECHEDDGDDNDDDGSDDDGSDDDGSGDDGSDDDGSGDDGSGGEDPDGELPVWCEANLDIDADCDGINDETGQPIY